MSNWGVEMDIIITVDPAKDLQETVSSLGARGFRVVAVLEQLHIVKVKADAAQLKEVRDFLNVMSAEPDTTVRIDPRENPNLEDSGSSLREPVIIGSSWRSPNWDR
jgi:hypothetical protein